MERSWSNRARTLNQKVGGMYRKGSALSKSTDLDPTLQKIQIRTGFVLKVFKMYVATIYIDLFLRFLNFV